MCARTLLLCIAVLLLNWVAKAQSTDEVHVSFPGTPSTPTAREAHGSVDAMARSFRVDVNLVLVPVTVTDSLGRPVIALSQQDFTVYEGTNHRKSGTSWRRRRRSRLLCFST
jgi:Ca-activated chloride channel family protein